MENLPYRTNACSSLELKIINLGTRLEDSGQNVSQIEKETVELLNKFGYKKIYSRQLSVDKISYLSVSYYNLEKRLVVLSSKQTKEYCELFAFNHDYFYTAAFNIYYSQEFDPKLLNCLKGLDNPISNFLDLFFTEYLQPEDKLIFINIISKMDEIKDLKSFEKMF